MVRIPLLISLFAFLVMALLYPLNVNAQRSILIRDAEIEATIQAYATPIFEVAGLNPRDIRLYLVQDDSINAFVAGGQRMFINTGLILKSEHPGQLIGVIAHETGHIAGAHLAGLHREFENAAAASVISYVLAGLAGAAAGNADLAAAVVAGSQGSITRSFFGYTRSQEGAADQAALRYLDATKQSSRGFLEFFDVLKHEELLITNSRDPYVRTHPLTQQRIDQVARHVESSPYADAPQQPEFIRAHARMRAKLFGYIRPIGVILRKYRRSDDSIESRYARAIGWFKEARVGRAVELIDSLIADEPNNPYFHELKGDGLWRNGDAAGAVASLLKAVELLPESDLIRRQLAQAQLSFNDPELAAEAVSHLVFALKSERNAPGVWSLLGRAYHILGDEANGRLAQGEAELLKGDYRAAIYHSGKARTLFEPNSTKWLRADDVHKVAAARFRNQQKE